MVVVVVKGSWGGRFVGGMVADFRVVKRALVFDVLERCVGGGGKQSVEVLFTYFEVRGRARGLAAAAGFTSPHRQGKSLDSIHLRRDSKESGEDY